MAKTITKDELSAELTQNVATKRTRKPTEAKPVYIMYRVSGDMVVEFLDVTRDSDVLVEALTSGKTEFDGVKVHKAMLK